jgi:hypothetical protein
VVRAGLDRLAYPDGRGVGGRATWLLFLPVPVWTLTLAVALNGLCSGLFYPRFFSTLTTSTPPALRARVMTSVTIAVSAPAPLGFLGAGYLSQPPRPVPTLIQTR